MKKPLTEALTHDYKEDAWHHVKDRTVGEILNVFYAKKKTAKTILMNYSCLDSHVRSKPRGETRMVPDVHSVANPFLFYLWSNNVFKP